MPNRVVHFEIAGRDGARLEEFYSKLLGWKIHPSDMGGFPYGFIDAAASAKLTGGIRHEPEGPAEVVLYVEVDDLERSVDRARHLGASLRIPPMEGDGVRFALLSDPEGNPIGLVGKEQQD